MQGQAHWITLAVVFGGAAFVIAVVALVGHVHRILQLRRYETQCPVLERAVHVAVLQDASSERWLDIRACSAFGDPSNVACEKACRGQHEGAQLVV